MPRFIIEGGIPTIHSLTEEPPPDGVTIKMLPIAMQRDASAGPTIASAAIMFTSTVATGLLTNWLYDYLKKRGTRKIRINRKEITIEGKEETVRIIEESIQIDE